MGHFEVASGAAGIISSRAVGVWSEKTRELERQTGSGAKGRSSPPFCWHMATQMKSPQHASHEGTELRHSLSPHPSDQVEQDMAPS